MYIIGHTISESSKFHFSSGFNERSQLNVTNFPSSEIWYYLIVLLYV